MNRSSSRSEPGSPGLFDGVLARGPVRELVADDAWIQAMLRVEAALARALARAGVIPAGDAEAIERATANLRLDPAELGREAAATGSPVVPLVAAIRRAVDGPASAAVHRGATSQDIIDSAAMLIASAAMDAIQADLVAAADAAADLARTHRDTTMAGRTLLQQAAPTTFGLKAAGWLTGLDEAATRVDEVRRTRLAVQLGGAVGTLAALGTDGPAVAGYLAEDLGLAEPVLPWHTQRNRIADIATAVGTAAGVVGKVAQDLVLLAQTEVGEAVDGTPGRGGSSSLPHKRNPVAAVAALAASRQAPGLVASLLGSMVQEHERAAGAWHAEWRPLRELLIVSGSGAAWLVDALEHLEVDRERLRANLGVAGGMLVSERLAAALAPHLGAQAAGDLLGSIAREAEASGRDLRDVLLEDARVDGILAAEEVEALLDVDGYLGSAGPFVDRALAAHDARRRGASEPATGDPGPQARP